MKPSLVANSMCQWRIELESTCQLCGSPMPTTSHILNGCYVALRYTDSVLLQLVKDIQTILPRETLLYAHLDGKQAEGNPPATIPPNVLCTPLRPYIVVVEEENMWLLELTNLPRGLAEAKSRKQHVICVATM